MRLSTPASADRLSCTAVLALLLFSGSGVPGHAQPGQENATLNPIVIAHRGASGYLPEHTLEAYSLAYGLGADFIEPDLVLTRDGVFICLHDIHLEDTTDVESRYPERQRKDGHYYAADFSLAEIETLQVHERLERRFPQGQSSFDVPTFRKMIELVQGLNSTTGKNIGIYPELKAGAWHRRQGLAMEERFLTLVREYGYQGPDAPIFVQSFEPESLAELRRLGSRLPQVLLLGDRPQSRDWVSSEGLERASELANGIGPSKSLIEKDPALVGRAHRQGLVVHPYTFRADDLGDGYESLDGELERFYADYGVDGLFTDHPDVAVIWLSRNGRR